MTETRTDPGRGSGHLDADIVADLDEGLLPPAEAALVRAHLARCADCAALDRALSGLRLLLRSSAGPGPLPAEVAARMDLALARAQAEEDRRGVAAERPAARRAARAWRLRTVLGGLAAVAAAGLVAVPLLQGTGGGDDSASGAATADSAGASGSTAGGTDLAPESALSDGYITLRSGVDYAPSTLAATASRLLRGASAARDAPAPHVTLADPLARLQDPTALRSCVAAVQALDTVAGSPPIALDLARYAGRPAAVLVLPLVPARPGQALAVAVGPSCGRGAADIRGRAVLTR